MQLVCFVETGYYKGFCLPTMLPKHSCYILLFSVNTTSELELLHVIMPLCIRAHKWLKDLLLAHPEQAAVGGGRRLSLSPARLAAVSPVLFWYVHSE